MFTARSLSHHEDVEVKGRERPGGGGGEI